MEPLLLHEYSKVIHSLEYKWNGDFEVRDEQGAHIYGIYKLFLIITILGFFKAPVTGTYNFW